METKSIRCYLKTWRKLRREIPARRGETCADYIDRVVKVKRK